MRTVTAGSGAIVLGLLLTATLLHAGGLPRDVVPTSSQATRIRVALAGPAPAPPGAPPRVTRLPGIAPAPPALPQDLHVEAINSARASASLAALPPGIVAALSGGVALSPLAPAAGPNSLGWRAASPVVFSGDQVDFTLPSSDTPWQDVLVYLDVQLVPNKLYMLDCRLVANNNHNPTIEFAYDDDAFATTDPDPKTKHSFFAFHARAARARLNLTGRRKAAEAPQAWDTLTFYGCTLLPAE